MLHFSNEANLKNTLHGIPRIEGLTVLEDIDGAETVRQ